MREISAVPSGLMQSSKIAVPTLKGWAILTHPFRMKTSRLVCAICQHSRVEVLAALVLCFVLNEVAGQTNHTVAFLGAEGFGQFANGGNGAETVHVTNLSDSGAGSFREAVSKPGRFIVFDVGGTIRLKANVAVSSRLTLAGETAPGEGITIYGRSVSFSGQSNIIARYLRFREGIEGDRGKCSVNISGGNN